MKLCFLLKYHFSPILENMETSYDISECKEVGVTQYKCTYFSNFLCYSCYCRLDESLSLKNLAAQSYVPYNEINMSQLATSSLLFPKIRDKAAVSIYEINFILISLSKNSAVISYLVKLCLIIIIHINDA